MGDVLVLDRVDVRGRPSGRRLRARRMLTFVVLLVSTTDICIPSLIGMGAVRFSLGRSTTAQELETVVQSLREVLA
jgi:hypothetical protein